MQKNKALAWVILIVLSLIWGSSFILMKRGLDNFSSDVVAALRITIAFLFLAPLFIKHYKINLKNTDYNPLLKDEVHAWRPFVKNKYQARDWILILARR